MKPKFLCKAEKAWLHLSSLIAYSGQRQLFQVPHAGGALSLVYSFCWRCVGLYLGHPLQPPFPCPVLFSKFLLWITSTGSLHTLTRVYVYVWVHIWPWPKTRMGPLFLFSWHSFQLHNSTSTVTVCSFVPPLSHYHTSVLQSRASSHFLL